MSSYNNDVAHGTDVHRATPLCVECIPICLDITYGVVVADTMWLSSYMLHGLLLTFTDASQVHFTLIGQYSDCQVNNIVMEILFKMQVVLFHKKSHCESELCIVGTLLDDTGSL